MEQWSEEAQLLYHRTLALLLAVRHVMPPFDTLNAWRSLRVPSAFVGDGREQVVVLAYPSHEPGATLAMVVLILEGSSPDVDCRFHKRIQMPGFDPQQVNYAHRTTCDPLDHYRNFLR